jgi:hypothetical protein
MNRRGDDLVQKGRTEFPADERRSRQAPIDDGHGAGLIVCTIVVTPRADLLGMISLGVEVDRVDVRLVEQLDDRVVIELTGRTNLGVNRTCDYWGGDWREHPATSCQLSHKRILPELDAPPARYAHAPIGAAQSLRGRDRERAFGVPSSRR